MKSQGSHLSEGKQDRTGERIEKIEDGTWYGVHRVVQRAARALKFNGYLTIFLHACFPTSHAIQLTGVSSRGLREAGPPC